MKQRINVQKPDGTGHTLSAEEVQELEEFEKQNAGLHGIGEALRLADIRNPIMTDRVIDELFDTVGNLATIRWASIRSPGARQDDDSAESKALRKINSNLDTAKAAYAALIENAARKWVADTGRVEESNNGGRAL